MFASLFLFASILAAQKPVTLTWNLNPENDVAGYVLYYGKASGIYSRSVEVTAPPVTVTTTTKKTFFVVTAFDTMGLESGYSNEVHYP